MSLVWVSQHIWVGVLQNVYSLKNTCYQKNVTWGTKLIFLQEGGVWVWDYLELDLTQNSFMNYIMSQMGATTVVWCSIYMQATGIMSKLQWA